MWAKLKRSRRMNNTSRNSLASRRHRGRLARFEPLEQRCLLSAANVFAEFVGLLSPTDDVHHIDISVAPAELDSSRNKAVLGFHLAAAEGNDLDPSPVQIYAEDGSTMRLRSSQSDLPGTTDSLVIAELDGGNYRLDVSGDVGAYSQFRMKVFLAGDVDGDHRVDRGDLEAIRASYGARIGSDAYDVAADVNMDGRITGLDLSLARKNEVYSRASTQPAIATENIFLAGDVDGDHRVDRGDLDVIRASYGARIGSSLYLASADVNMDGRISALDLSLARKNEINSRSSTQPVFGTAALMGTSSDDPTVGGRTNDGVAAVTPQEGFDPDTAMRFYESTEGWVQPYASAMSVDKAVFATSDVSKLAFDWIFREASYNNSLYIYKVDNAQGELWDIDPTYEELSREDASDYRTAALQNKEQVFSPGERDNFVLGHLVDTPTIPSGWSYFSFYVVQNGSSWEWFPFDLVNVDESEHYKEITTSDDGKPWYEQWYQGTLGFKVEDLSYDPTNFPNPGGFDEATKDFNDVVFQFVPQVDIDSVDTNFAPGVENLDVKYTIEPGEYTASYGKIEVFKNGDAANPIYKDDTITMTGTNVLYEWDGKANQGASSGKYVGPEDSPYTIKVSISELADFGESSSDTKTTKVEVHSIALTPAGAENVIKPNKTAIEIDKDIEALVKIKKKDGTGALTEIPIKIDWSFEDPDDTATSAGIDPNGGAGDDNAPIAKGGKRGAASVMWKAVTGFTTTVNNNVAESETKVTGADKGKTKIQFSTSAIGGDNYILVAQCKDASGTVLKEKKTGTWSVRKTVTFPNVYNMNGGVDAGTVMAVANIDPAFSGDGYTDYTVGTVTDLAAGAKSPEYVVPLLPPNAAETPSGQELATYGATSTPDVNVAPLGDFPGPGDIDHDSDGNIDTFADIDVAPLGNFPGPEDTDHNSDGNLDRVATAADKAIAEFDIETRALAWYNRNKSSYATPLGAYVQLIGATSPCIIGARYYGLKLDGRDIVAEETNYYPAGISITTSWGTFDPDKDWEDIDGIHMGGFVFIFSNSTRTQVVGVHEAGHASDHESFGPGDHAASGVMEASSTVATFSDDSILRLRGWSP